MTDRPQTLLDSIPSSFDPEPAWLCALRSEAAAQLRDQGLPNKKTEAWRFTPVRSVVDSAFVLRPEGSPTLVGTPPAGVVVRSLREVLEREPDLLDGHLGQTNTEHFAALNTALFRDGLWIHVEANAVIRAPLELRHALDPGDGAQVEYPRVLVTAARGSQATLIETYEGSAPEGLTNSLVEVELESNARLHHVRIHQNHGRQVGRIEVRQEADSAYHSVAVTLGGALCRLDLRARLQGPGAECTLEGAYLVDGTDLVDHHTLVEHEAPHCRSAQTYRGIADGRGTAVFDGIVVVHRDAQKTEAHQENRNLLLSDTATVHTKPHLEIDADDVVCSHGATVGALDAGQLFYLRTRGIPEGLARAMLTYAFIEQIIDRVGDEATRDRLRETVLSRIPQGEVIRGVT